MYRTEFPAVLWSQQVELARERLSIEPASSSVGVCRTPPVRGGVVSSRRVSSFVMTSIPRLVGESLIRERVSVKPRTAAKPGATRARHH
jgi:hypothetical protein